MACQCDNSCGCCKAKAETTTHLTREQVDAKLGPIYEGVERAIKELKEALDDDGWFSTDPKVLKELADRLLGTTNYADACAAEFYHWADRLSAEPYKQAA